MGDQRDAQVAVTWGRVNLKRLVAITRTILATYCRTRVRDAGSAHPTSVSGRSGQHYQKFELQYDEQVSKREMRARDTGVVDTPRICARTS